MALDELIADKEGCVAPIGAKSKAGDSIPALIFTPSIESQFASGRETIEHAISFRVSHTYMTEAPNLHTIWLVRGMKYRLTRIVPHAICFVLELEDPNN